MFILAPVYLIAQVVSLNPAFPTQTDNVTITFDAAQGNSALLGQTVVYAHTGVITNLSTSSTDWRNVIGNWGTDDARVKMVSIGNNKFQLTFNINTFYGITGTEKILKLAFVFRNLDGSKVGRNSDGSDIFSPISDGTFQLSITTNPSFKPLILYPNDSLKLHAICSNISAVTMLIDSTVVTQTTTNRIDTVLIASSIGNGLHWVKVSALFNNKVYKDSIAVIVRGSNSSNVGFPPAGTKDGINYINDTTVVLQLIAPQKSFVYVVGDFTDWQLLPNFELTKTPDGNRFWIKLNNLKPNIEYGFQYVIDKEQIFVADPFADKFLDQYNDSSIPSETYPNLKPYPYGKTKEYVSVFQTAQQPYNWLNTAFTKPSSNKLVIYELLIRDFVGKHNYQTLIDTIAYLKRLGVNAIELMPFNEFEGNESWGYNTVFYFAPDKYYGTKNKLKEFIDVCHGQGIAVIMDMVLNHSFGQSSMVRMYFDNTTGKPLNNPWFNSDATHPFNVGFDFNHESSFTQALVDTVLKYWVNEYKIDGYRFDLSKGFTQRNNPNNIEAWGMYDLTRVNIWKRIANQFKPTCADCYMILEHFADNTEEKELSENGFMLWGNHNYAFNESTMGYSSDLRSAIYQYKTWTKPNLVNYAESHDEERLMYKNINYGSSVSGYNTKDTLTALSRMEAAAVILAAIPGPYMIWQFGELGYPYSINTCTDGTVNNACRLSNKPIRWDYLNQPSRRRLYDVYASINNLKTSHKVFQTNSFSYNLNSSVKTLLLSDSSMDVFVAANFGTTTNKVIRTITHPGWWYNYYYGDSVFFNSTTDTIFMLAGNYQILTDVKLTKPIISYSTGVKNHEKELFNVEVYPNPTSNELFINTSIPLVDIEIADLTGRVVYTSLTNPNNAFKIGNLINGCYMLKINTTQSIIFRKIVINK